MLNWGLFLGGKVDCKGHRFVLKYIAPSTHIYGVELLMPVDYAGYLQSGFLPDECKPILRPLSSMTDEEKKELKQLCLTIVPELNKDITCVYLDVAGCICIDIPLWEWYAGTKELLWLMSRRFFVGQCEETECIIEGGVR